MDRALYVDSTELPVDTHIEQRRIPKPRRCRIFDDPNGLTGKVEEGSRGLATE